MKQKIENNVGDIYTVKCVGSSITLAKNEQEPKWSRFHPGSMWLTVDKANDILECIIFYLKCINIASSLYLLPNSPAKLELNFWKYIILRIVLY